MIKLADIASFGQHYPLAIPMLQEVLDLDSTNLTGLMMMGEILTRQNNSGAMVYYERAYRQYPENQQVAYALGNWYIQSGLPLKAIPVCEHILEKDSVNIKFQKLMGFARYRSGDPVGAVHYFLQAVAQGDSAAFTFKYLGIANFQLADFKGAHEALEVATDRDSLDAEVHFFLGASLATTHRKEEAMHHLDLSLQLMKPDPAVVARIYSEEGNLMRLEMEYERAYDLYNLSWLADTTNPTALYYMASILDNSMHRSREALVDYRRFLDQLDRLPEDKQNNNQFPTIRGIVEDRIVQLKEELFFLGE
jgi:tetratricopeptide (TPR) repeat protein